ncbi:ATP-binding protein [Vibrio tapetis subsp. quintayensis]|uniref:ATP-binding protein n=1 Tax=Vibrio tapetis TaxID=52443 RepID=UPI0025B5307E|nr:ATP-binding protein [Vibrio tapetis]MDN3681179.1 ATP-binding protein [Vibrio tapetis subsp. quintayensis]
MWRIYIESLIGLIVLFAATLVTYEVVVFQLNTDHIVVLEHYRAQAMRDLVNETSMVSGLDNALDIIKHFARSTHEVFDEQNIQDTPKHVQYYLANNPEANTFADQDNMWWFTLDNSELIYSLYINENSPLVQAVWFADNLVWAFFFVGFGLYCMGLIWFLSRRFRRLEEVTLRFANGDFSARVSEKSGHRVGKLNRNFNHMADKISALITSNKALTNAVAHELRTPVFRIQWQAELLLEQLNGVKRGYEKTERINIEYEKKSTKVDLIASNQKSVDSVESIIEDTEEMETLVNELLYYAKAERADNPLDCQEIDVNSWFSQEILKWQRGYSLQIEYLPIELNHLVSADTSLISRAVSNLTRNALRYANKRVLIKPSLSDHQLRIEVHDDGCGVPKEHWSMLFEPFYRADKSRDKKLGGHGLGLAIVKQIALRYRGSAAVTDSELGGACFTLILELDVCDCANEK